MSILSGAVRSPLVLPSDHRIWNCGAKGANVDWRVVSCVLYFRPRRRPRFWENWNSGAFLWAVRRLAVNRVLCPNCRATYRDRGGLGTSCFVIIAASRPSLTLCYSPSVCENWNSGGIPGAARRREYRNGLCTSRCWRKGRVGLDASCSVPSEVIMPSLSWCWSPTI
jgi:hypothetical protein